LPNENYYSFFIFNFMKKNYFPLLLTVLQVMLLPQFVGAQNCPPATAYADLNINQVNTRILNGGDLWWDPAAAASQYEVPAGSGKNVIYAGALWMGGIDTFGQLRVAAQTYRQTGNDYFAGVLDNNGEVSNSTCSDFDHVWKVNGSDIDAFISDFIAGGSQPMPTTAVPTDLLQWPARNNPHFSSFTLPPNKDLAPFYDTDQDGNYDPTQGDYPAIEMDKPAYADQMTWCVFNDKGNDHSESEGMPLSVEVGLLAYAFSEPDMSSIDHATFYRYTLRNYGATRLDSFRVGLFTDPDLGGYTDDFVGCVPAQNMGYVYNCDNSDAVYGANPPVVGIQFLEPLDDENGNSVNMASFAVYNNDFTPRGNPSNTDDFYSYLNARWKDDTPFTYGGNGYGGDTPTNFMYDGTPSSPNDWSECAAGNACGDRRFVMAMDYITLPRFAPKSFTVGVYYAANSGGCPNTSLTGLLSAASLAQVYHDNLNLLAPIASPAAMSNWAVVRTYPNPVLEQCVVEANPYIKTITMYDLMGKKMASLNTTAGKATIIETSTWANGCYLLQATAQNGTTYTQKILK
jgi:hypothetical protein